MFPEGLKKVASYIQALKESDYLLLNSDLLPIQSKAKILAADFKHVENKAEYWTIMALAVLVRLTNIFPHEALVDAVNLHPEFSDRYLKSIETSERVLSLITKN